MSLSDARRRRRPLVFTSHAASTRTQSLTTARNGKTTRNAMVQINQTAPIANDLKISPHLFSASPAPKFFFD